MNVPRLLCQLCTPFEITADVVILGGSLACIHTLLNAITITSMTKSGRYTVR